jgi:transcriptional regulator with XRE-family HTH domain
MTKKYGSTDINSSARKGARMDLLRPEYTDREWALLSELQSYVNVSRAVLRNRLDRGLTQDELGRAAGTKQSRISDLEAMQGNPRFDTLDRIARVLDLAIDLVPRSAAAHLPAGYVSYGTVMSLTRASRVGPTDTAQPVMLSSRVVWREEAIRG